jgi:multicomponent Na+:H+ antiporter subunit G
MIDVVVGLLALAGGAFAVIAALGLVRLPDVLIRMHAATKVGTLSAGLVMAAVALHEADAAATLRAVAIVLFMFLTAPIAAHMIGRAALRMGVPLFRTDAKPFRESEAPQERRAPWEDRSS